VSSRKPSARAIEAAIEELVQARGTATACPSEVARKIGGEDWRELMEPVRRAAARLQERGLVDVYQHGRAVKLATARGPVRLRSSAAAEIDHRKQPERYVIGRGEEGVLTVEPYKSELLPLWRFATVASARRSAAALWKKFVSYGEEGDFVGMDMARKYLQMGWTRARRYAKHKSGRKYAPGTRSPLANDPSAEKAAAAEVFRATLERARKSRVYARLKAEHLARRG
jgi:hypothetical protein